jgi:hypothetical protein
MSVVIAILIVLGAAAIAVVTLLRVRRGAPDGGYFNDGDRAAGAFGVLATGFSVLLGFVVFLAFTSYDDSRSAAETEATLVVQQFETAQFFPADAASRLGGGIVCYARSVVYDEWPRLQDGSGTEAINPWGIELFRVLVAVEPGTPSEEAAFSKWLDQTSEREQARDDRLHAADGVVPPPRWVVLFVTGGVVFGFMLFFADRGERALVQSVLIGSVVVVVSSALVLLWFLDNPYQPGAGGLEPVAMERSLELLDEARLIVGDTGPLPCDESGRPVAAAS